MTRIRIWLTGLCLLLVGIAAAGADTTGVRAWLDHDSVQFGETVTLNVEAQAGSIAQPDFTPLKQDFNLLQTQSSQQISIVNGVSTSKTLWAIGLEPKHEGRITIAPIAVGTASTAAISVNVLAQASPASAKAGGEAFLEVTAEPMDPYVQQQVRYVAKLYFAFDLTDGNLSAPQADGLGVQQLGQERKYVTTVGARRYNVVERRYTLTPERSGVIDVPALVFRGTALDATDPTGFFSRGRSVSARSDPVHLDVRPKPASWTDGAWLPAASVLLKDETDLPDEVHVGDPVTRTIRLQAQGLGFEQLPELVLAAPEGAEMYPDKAETRTREDGEWTYGERVRKFAFVPNRPGTLTIPGITVNWWNTAENRAEVAQLPARTIRVLATAGGGAGAVPPAHGAVPMPASPGAAAVPASTPIAGPAAGDPSTLRRWQSLAMLASALWLITLVAWWRARRPRLSVGAVLPDVAPDSSSQRAAFLRACSLAEYAGAERALVAWARNERPEVRNLGELAGHLDDETQRSALGDLQRARYAGTVSDGLAGRLQAAFKNGIGWRATPGGHARASGLPVLYAHRD